MKNEYEVVTVRYEHRVIAEHNAGDFYGKDYIFEVGKVLKHTNTPEKNKYYGETFYGVSVNIPAEKVRVFKITKVAKVTETEELAE